MKARCRLNPEDGLWYCARMGITGCGKTVSDAIEDIKVLHAEMLDNIRKDRIEYSFKFPKGPRA